MTLREEADVVLVGVKRSRHSRDGNAATLSVVKSKGVKRAKVEVAAAGPAAAASVKMPPALPIKVLLAKDFAKEKKQVNPAGWWLSEKLDGLRAWWCPRRGGLYSRNGNRFPAPKSFTQHLPKHLVLDGELFMGRGRFSETTSAVKKQGQESWPSELKFHVFDAPSMHSAPFEERVRAIEVALEDNPVAVPVAHYRCRDAAHLEQETDRYTAAGGEGVMMREKGSKYVGSRSSTLLKYKRFFDAEARVVGHEEGNGRCYGMMGALYCEMECGLAFKVGSGFTDQQRKNPPTAGAIITYRFQELTKSGVPRFPTFVGEPIDKTEPSDNKVPSSR